MATLIDGKKIAQQICTEIEENIKNLKQKHSDFNSKLAIIQVRNYFNQFPHFILLYFT